MFIESMENIEKDLEKKIEQIFGYDINRFDQVNQCAQLEKFNRYSRKLDQLEHEHWTIYQESELLKKLIDETKFPFNIEKFLKLYEYEQIPGNMLISEILEQYRYLKKGISFIQFNILEWENKYLDSTIKCEILNSLEQEEAKLKKELLDLEFRVGKEILMDIEAIGPLFLEYKKQGYKEKIDLYHSRIDLYNKSKELLAKLNMRIEFLQYEFRLGELEDNQSKLYNPFL